MIFIAIINISLFLLLLFVIDDWYCYYLTANLWQSKGICAAFSRLIPCACRAQIGSTSSWCKSAFKITHKRIAPDLPFKCLDLTDICKKQKVWFYKLTNATSSQTLKVCQFFNYPRVSSVVQILAQLKSFRGWYYTWHSWSSKKNVIKYIDINTSSNIRSQCCFQRIFWGIYLLANILMTHPCSDKSPTARLLFENSCKHETSEKGLLWKVGCLKIVVIVKLQIASSSMRSMLRAVAKELKGFIFVAFRNFIWGNWCRVGGNHNSNSIFSTIRKTPWEKLGPAHIPIIVAWVITGPTGQGP